MLLQNRVPAFLCALAGASAVAASPANAAREELALGSVLSFTEPLPAAGERTTKRGAASDCSPTSITPTSTDPTNTDPTSSPLPYTAQEVIDALGLAPSNEKGYFAETFRDPDLAAGTNRSVGTAIYYLLEGRDARSRWHRVDAAEVWHWYAGAPLSLYLSRDDGSPTRERRLGPRLLGGEGEAEAVVERPQAVVAKGEWQQARSWGDWSLVGTTVAPAFVESGFELAPPGWEPRGGSS